MIRWRLRAGRAEEGERASAHEGGSAPCSFCGPNGTTSCRRRRRRRCRRRCRRSAACSRRRRRRCTSRPASCQAKARAVRAACSRRTRGGQATEVCTTCAAEGVLRAGGGRAPFKEQLTTCSGGYTGPKARDIGPEWNRTTTGLRMRLEGCRCCSFRASCCCQTRKCGLAATIMHQWRTSASTFRPPGSLLLRSSTRRSSACNALRVEEFVWPNVPTFHSEEQRMDRIGLRWPGAAPHAIIWRSRRPQGRPLPPWLRVPESRPTTTMWSCRSRASKTVLIASSYRDCRR